MPPLSTGEMNHDPTIVPEMNENDDELKLYDGYDRRAYPTCSNSSLEFHVQPN